MGWAVRSSDRYIDSERELSNHCTSALFVRAQKYEPTGLAPHETDAIHDALLDWRHRSDLQTFLAVDRTLRGISESARVGIAAVFEPRSWPGVAGDDEGARSPLEAAFRRPRGSFVVFALQSRTAMAAMRDRKKESTVLEFLTAELGDAKRSQKLRRSIFEECERRFEPLIQEYDVARLARLEVEAKEAAEATAKRARAVRERLRGRQASPALLDASDAVLDLARLMGIAP